MDGTDWSLLPWFTGIYRKLNLSDVMALSAPANQPVVAGAAVGG